ARLSPEVRVEDRRKFTITRGRWHSSPKKDVLESVKTKGCGTGLEAEFWTWCEQQTKKHA
ncbi:hypothetical protein BGZ57DRAFT_774323, partial [Hyaloscypha finlandica]